MSSDTTTASWQAYHERFRGRPARPTLQSALRLFAAQEPVGVSGLAVDLGCGGGQDTLALLEQGWRVLAVDLDVRAVTGLHQHLPSELRARLQIQQAAFEELELPDAQLINASYSLPFCRPEAFEGLWQQIVSRLEHGGRFAGQLFGDRDAWANEPGMTFHTRQGVDALFSPDDFVIERLTEVEEDRPTAFEGVKRWHLFHVIARRI